MNKREEAIKLVNAYFDGKCIEVKDPMYGIRDWLNLKYIPINTYLKGLCDNVEKYRILDN